jgi:hypothetical protein
MTLNLGNVTMNLGVDKTNIGYTVLPNLVLKPGNNTVPMRAKIDPLVVFGLVTSKYKNAIIPVDITGNSTVYNGVNLKYFEESLNSNAARVQMNVAPALKAMGINITQI